ncbi:MAG TPA: CNNM domain-containing protein [Actinocatenispora sp.]
MAALAFITFVHIVIGEMAPKSAVITHPESSARALGLPFRAFARVARPGLAVLNGAANLALRLVRVTPVTELDTTRDPAELRVLLRQSHEAGLLPAEQYRTLDGTLALRVTAVDALMRPRDRMATVPAGASPADIQDAQRRTGRSRFPVVAADGNVVGVVHVRHTLVTDRGTARELARPPLVLRAGTDAYAALATMRSRRTHLALVSRAGALVGLVTLEDLVEQLIDEFDDETDRPVAATAP